MTANLGERKTLLKIDLVAHPARTEGLINIGGVRGVMVTVVGNGYDDPSSSSGRNCFHIALITLGKV